MATERQLFDKPMAELCEAFVRNRFGQEDVLGNPSIEEWLSQQRNAERPNHRWWRLIEAGRVQPDLPLDIRRTLELAIPQKFPPGFALAQEEDVSDPLLGVLIESIDRTRVDVLPCNERLTLFALRMDGVPSRCLAIERQLSPSRTMSGVEQYTLRAAGGNDFLFAVLARGWEVGAKEITVPARKFLCNALDASIRKERAKAEHDFDTAVAVSPGGEKIVHADWVVVFEKRTERRKPTLFSTAPFRTRKARLGVSGGRVAVGVKENSREYVLAWVRECMEPPMFEDTYDLDAHHVDHRVIEVSDSARRSFNVLFIRREFCPSPLPNGGVEVTV